MSAQEGEKAKAAGKVEEQRHIRALALRKVEVATRAGS